MSNILHVCLYNTELASSEKLGNAIRSLNFVRLQCEVSTPDELAATLQDTPINLIFFHLDPDPGPVVEVIEHVVARHPNVAMVAMSHQTKPEAILAPMRAGCDQFVCEPIDPADLATAVSRVASKRLLSQATSRRICITSASGGAGSTSLACNLAVEIANQTERECALVDLNMLFGDVAMSFDREPKYTMYDLAVGGSEIDRSILMSTLTKLSSNVSILARPEMMEHQEAISPDLVYRVIEVLATEFENVIMDVPRNLSPISTAALGQADQIFIVCQLLVPSIRNAERYHDALLRMGVPGERIEFIINRFDGRSGRVTRKDLESTIKKSVYATIPNDYQFVARSIDFGRPVAALEETNPVRAAIRRIAQQIVSEVPVEPDERKPERKGLLSRFLAK